MMAPSAVFFVSVGDCDGWVALGSYPPRAPTDPDVHDSRIRLL